MSGVTGLGGFAFPGQRSDYPPTDLTKFITGPIEFTDGTGDEPQRPIEQPGSSPAS